MKKKKLLKRIKKKRKINNQKGIKKIIKLKNGIIIIVKIKEKKKEKNRDSEI